jgi:putative N6-adenine-specific DNA methylase
MNVVKPYSPSNDPSEHFAMVATTLDGLEPVLKNELIAMGAHNVTELDRAVSFSGNMETMMRANLCLRTAIRILIPWQKFEIRSADDLYFAALPLSFEDLFSVDQTFAIHASVQSDFYDHPHYASLKLKDAIADHFRNLFQRRPDVSPQQPDMQFHLFIRGKNVEVQIDTSGDSLHKRGYRQGGGEAPLNEVLAAGMILHSGWNGQGALIDPMCGSGTILSEALLIASDVYPQWSREDFTFMNWKNFPKKLFTEIIRDLESKAHEPLHKLFGYDIDRKQLRKAQDNLEDFPFSDFVHLEGGDFFKLSPPQPEGWLIINPPYGERLPLDEAREFYSAIGSRLKHHWSGYSAWILSGNLPALKVLGLKPSAKHTVYNGGLECRYQGYQLFSGTRKEFRYGPE